MPRDAPVTSMLGIIAGSCSGGIGGGAKAIGST
jgi:hypothetical protein